MIGVEMRLARAFAANRMCDAIDPWRLM